MAEINQAEGVQGVRGWLLLLSKMLTIWHPIFFGLTAASALGALPVRGASLGILLVWRLAVTAFGVAAGIALYSKSGAAVTMATASLSLSAATDVFVYTTSYFPSNRMPGDTPIYIAGTVVYYGSWILYLLRSKRVRNTYR
jgi:hypothetical protein